MRSTLRMVQEGDVLDLTNNTGDIVQPGVVMFSDGFVGMTNAAAADGKKVATIVRGVVEVAFTTGNTALVKGDKISLNVDTGALVISPADSVWDMDAPENDLITFGRSLHDVEANSTKRIWVAIKPQ